MVDSNCVLVSTRKKLFTIKQFLKSFEFLVFTTEPIFCRINKKGQHINKSKGSIERKKKKVAVSLTSRSFKFQKKKNRRNLSVIIIFF